MLKTSKFFVGLGIVLDIAFIVVEISTMNRMPENAAKYIWACIKLGFGILVSIACLCSMHQDNISVATGVFLSIFCSQIGAILYWVWFARAYTAAEISASKDYGKRSASVPLYSSGYLNKPESMSRSFSNRVTCPCCNAEAGASEFFCPHCGSKLR